jgi:hypothetical protein
MCQARRRTESCKVRHVGVVHSRRLAIEHEDGTKVEIGPGEAYVIEPATTRGWLATSGSSVSSSSRERRRNTRRAKARVPLA